MMSLRMVESNELSTTAYISKIFNEYESHIRGKNKSEFGIAYWDVIVITTADGDQKSVYEQQIKLKYERGELPLGVPIHIVADPPGPKIGNGGSTLVSIEALWREYGEKLYEKKVLLIHAGGQSQRMPSASVLGKIFSPIPKGNPMYQMLDIKLAMFCPLIVKMHPGIFVTCADDFTVYDLGADEVDLEFSKTGFTALAHPSSLTIGTGHGVYVVNKVNELNCKKALNVCKCLEVLQKPSVEKMKEKGAVFKSTEEVDSFKNKAGVEFCTDGLTHSRKNKAGGTVFTDSSFGFSHTVTKKFLKFIQENGPLKCEVDAYGDFLQALGIRATSSYVDNVSNVSSLCNELIPTRHAIFNLLKNTELLLLIMNRSKFIHIGTTTEYISHYCTDSRFQGQMGLSKDVFNLWTRELKVESQEIGSGEPPIKKPCRSAVDQSDTLLGCVMHSILPETSNIASTAVVEFCNFAIPVNVGQNCIISNCEFTDVDISGGSSTDSNIDAHENNQPSLDIPNNLFLHTIPILDGDSRKYVTIFFDIDDNLKKVAQTPKQLRFLGKLVDDFATVAHIDTKVMISDCSESESKVNLWHCSLFPLTDSMTESLKLALKCILALKTDDLLAVSLTDKKLVSMATILRQKHVFEMLKQRTQVYNRIKERNTE